MTKAYLNLCIDEPQWLEELSEIEQLASLVITQTVDFVNNNEAPDFFALGKPLSFNLCLSRDDDVHELNLKYRGMDKATNVLSFANIDDPCFDDDIAETEMIEMGDIIIALETMQKEAQIKGISLHDHFCHLLTHGVLHLLGYDHIEDDEAEHMESFEVKILDTLNINNPYKE